MENYIVSHHFQFSLGYNNETRLFGWDMRRHHYWSDVFGWQRRTTHALHFNELTSSRILSNVSTFASKIGWFESTAKQKDTLWFNWISCHHQNVRNLYFHKLILLIQFIRRINRWSTYEFAFSWFLDTADVYSYVVTIQLITSTVWLACAVFQMDLVLVSFWFDFDISWCNVLILFSS